MAMTTCRECGKEVSTEAKSCPHCGVAAPGKKPASVKDGLLGLAIMAALVGFGVYSCSDSDDDSAAKAAAAAQRDAACKTDLQCLGDRATITAAGPCKREIERYAKNSAQWTDGALEPKFSAFRWLDPKSEKLTLFGDKVQFQNGFGAWINMRYECDVDMSPDLPSVIAVRVAEGRM